MNPLQKKEIERKYARLLLEQLEMQDVALVDNLHPDFLIRSSGCTIGLELTELFRTEIQNGQPEHVRAFEQSKVIAEAREKYIVAGGVPLHVSIHFTNEKFTKQNRTSIAEWVANLILNNQPNPDSSFHWTWHDAEYGTYPDGINSVSAYCLIDGCQHFWQGPTAGFVNAGFEQVLVQAVKDKENKIESYLQNCKECWLMLIADWTQGASFFEWTSEAISWVPANRFSKIYFFDRFNTSGKRFIEVR